MKHLVMKAISILGAVALPAGVQAAADTATAKKVTDPNKMICHTEEVTGSLLATKRECHTAAQWDDIQRQQRADIMQAQSRSGR